MVIDHIMDKNALLFRYNIATRSISILPFTFRSIIMKKACIILFAVLLLAVCSCVHAESTVVSYEKTVNIHDALPPYIIRITDTGEDTDDLIPDNILHVEVFCEDGERLQAFTYFSGETPEYDGAAELVMAKDLNFDGYNDLMLLSGAGAQNVFHAISLWDSQTNQFRPVEVACNWNRETKRFDPGIRQLELCNVELIPEKKYLYSSVQDGYRYRRDICWGWESQYGITGYFIWDVYDAGDGLIGESLYQFGSQVI